MFFRTQESEMPGDAAWRESVRGKRRRAALIQVAVAAVLIAFLWVLGSNVAENLAERGIQHGFEFFRHSAGFAIGETPITFEPTDSFFRAFVIGVMNTIRVSVLAIISSFVLGIVIAFMKLSRQPVLRFFGAAHVEFYRNIPLIVGLLGVYLVITEILPDMETVAESGSVFMLDKAGLQFPVPLHEGAVAAASLAAGLVAGFLADRVARARSTFLVGWCAGAGAFCAAAAAVWIACGAVLGWSIPKLDGFIVEGGGSLSPEFLAIWLGLTLFSSAPIAETIRAGIVSVGRGQWQAGLSLGLSGVETASYVVFPQAMRLSVPPLASQFMNLTKNSSLAIVVGYPDVVSIGNTSINATGQALEMILLIMLVYLMLNLITSVVMNAINRRLARGRA